MNQLNNRTYEQWKTFQGLMYEYYSEHILSELPNITHSGWLSSIKTETFKYKQLQLYCISRKGSNKGLFSTFNISVPKQEGLNDTRTKPVLDKTNSVMFKNHITHVELLDSIWFQNRTNVKQAHILTLAKDCLKIVDTSKITQKGISKSMSNSLDIQEIVQVYSNGLQGFQIGQIPFIKNINVMKSKNQCLLLGCDDGQVIYLKLEECLGNDINQKDNKNFRNFKVKSPIADLTWLQDDPNNFFVMSKDGNGYLYDIRKPSPAMRLPSMHFQPISLIQIRENEFISSGRDCTLKFWDIKNQKSYTYQDNDSVITKMINLTGNISRSNNNSSFSYKNLTGLKQKDESIRFASCGQNGNITVWQNEPQFLHMGHRSAANSIDYNYNAGLFISSQQKQSKICIWKPILNIFQKQQQQYS